MMDKIKNWLTENLLKYPTGISDSEAVFIARTTEKLFNANVPEDYVSFLKEINGFSCNGVTVYGFENDEIKNKYKELIDNDFIYVNNDFREMTDVSDYLVFGQTDLSYIAMDTRSGKYVLLGRGFLDFIGEYVDFNEMLEMFLGLE